MKNTTGALIFVMFLYVSFCWVNAENKLQEERAEKQQLIDLVKRIDSVNTVNKEDHVILMNRIQFYTKNK